MKQQMITPKDLTRMALCTALLVIAGFIRFPLPMTPVPVSAQTLVVNLIALILLPKQAFFSSLVYLLIGLVGVPVFGGNGGIGAFAGPTGGFLIGFWLASFVISLAFHHCKHFIPNFFLRGILCTVFIGMPVIYLAGTAGMCFSLGTDIRSVLISSVIPFLFGDIIKCLAACSLASALSKTLSRSYTAS